MSLDKKLRELIADAFQDSRDTSLLVEHIKQAFADEGWYDLKTTTVNGRKWMSGQEWYEKFEKELKAKYDSFVEFADIDMNVYNHGKEAMTLASMEAARKAAGL